MDKIYTRKLQNGLEGDTESFNNTWLGAREVFNEGGEHSGEGNQIEDMPQLRASHLHICTSVFGNESVTEVACKGLEGGMCDKTSLSYGLKVWGREYLAKNECIGYWITSLHASRVHLFLLRHRSDGHPRIIFLQNPTRKFRPVLRFSVINLPIRSLPMRALKCSNQTIQNAPQR
jgi:hypothetical protein